MKSLKIKHNRKQKFLESTTNYIIYLHAIGISSLVCIRKTKDTRIHTCCSEIPRRDTGCVCPVSLARFLYKGQCMRKNLFS